VRHQIGHPTWELGLSNLGIDSKLRSSDSLGMRVRDVCHGSLVPKRALVIQQKAQRPLQLEITDQTPCSAAGSMSDEATAPAR
jgi:hypothetical protein